MLNSRASKAVLVTLLSVFEQCRAFGDPAENHVEEDQSINMVSNSSERFADHA